MSTTSTSTSCAPALRAAAALLDAHPDLPADPYITTSTTGRVSLSWYVQIDTKDMDEQKTIATQLVRALGGTWNKSAYPTSQNFRFRQRRGLLNLDIQVTREAVCERVVTGTREVTRDVPAQEAVEAHTVTEVVEDVEWVCAPLLAGAEAGAP